MTGAVRGSWCLQHFARGIRRNVNDSRGRQGWIADLHATTHCSRFHPPPYKFPQQAGFLDNREDSGPPPTYSRGKFRWDLKDVNQKNTLRAGKFGQVPGTSNCSTNKTRLLRDFIGTKVGDWRRRPLRSRSLPRRVERWRTQDGERSLLRHGRSDNQRCRGRPNSLLVWHNRPTGTRNSHTWRERTTTPSAPLDGLSPTKYT